jgi:hypothetical protein
MSGPPPGNTLPLIAKPIIVETDGVWGELQTGAIINAGGAAGPYFTVGGKALLFSDGTSTGSGGGTTLNLQTAYNNSPAVGGQAGIQLSVGKDFVINDTNNQNYFVVSSADGSVTINGDLTVNGTATTINTVVIQSDHQLISPASPTTIALNIQPMSGVTPIVDLVSIRRTFGSTPVFRIDLNGNLIATQNLTVGGLINGINIVALNTELQQHVAGTAYQHEAADVLITPISGIPGATNVQEALEALETQIQTGGGGISSDVRGYSYIQATPATSWTVNHNGNTLRATATIYDSTNEQVIPEQVQIIDANNVLITFSSALAGTALIILF